MLERLLTNSQALPADFSAHLVMALLVAFIVGQANAWVYRWTHRGVQYSRTFTHTLLLIAIVGALSMALIMINPLAALGLLGGMAIVRFRTMLRDPRDTVYVLLSLICGMAAGLGSYGVAILGCVFTNVLSFYLQRTQFGAWNTIDSLLRFQIPGSALNNSALTGVLGRFCRNHNVVSVDELPSRPGADDVTYQCTYKLQLRDPADGPDLIAALRNAFRIESVQLVVEPGDEDVN